MSLFKTKLDMALKLGQEYRHCGSCYRIRAYYANVKNCSNCGGKTVRHGESIKQANKH